MAERRAAWRIFVLAECSYLLVRCVQTDEALLILEWWVKDNFVTLQLDLYILSDARNS